MNRSQSGLSGHEVEAFGFVVQILNNIFFAVQNLLLSFRKVVISKIFFIIIVIIK